MAQDDVIQAILAIVRANVSGVNGVPNYPPEQIQPDYFPFVIGYAGTGEHTFDTNGVRKFLGEVLIELHVARQDLPVAVESAIGYGDTIPAALMADLVSASSTLQGVVLDTFESITQEFGELNWGELKTLGFRFIVNGVKIKSTL